MKKFVFCAALFAAITFAACSDDDDESNLPATPANIVGTWQIVNEQGYEDDHYDGYKDTWSEDYPYVDEDGWWYWTYTFDEGGTGTYTDIGTIDKGKVEYADSWKLNYSISGNTLAITIWYDDDEVEEESYQIKSLTKSKLVLFASEYGGDWGDGGSWENTTTYKRIK